MPNLSAFARLLGLPDDASEEAIVAAIEAQDRERLRREALFRALAMPPDVLEAFIVAEVARIATEQAEDVARLTAQIAETEAEVRAARVHLIIGDAVREANDTLNP